MLNFRFFLGSKKIKAREYSLAFVFRFVYSYASFANTAMTAALAPLCGIVYSFLSLSIIRQVRSDILFISASFSIRK